MCGEFGEVSGIIDLVINFLAGGTLFLNSYDTLSYAFAFGSEVVRTAERMQGTFCVNMFLKSICEQNSIS